MRRAGEEGASLVEYALLLALLIIVAVVGLTFLGANTSNSIEENTSTMQTAVTSP